MNNLVITAGGIVLKDDKILFIYKKGKWDLPKGKVEHGSNSRDTAVIEISEETGLPHEQLNIIEELIPTSYHKIINNVSIVKKTDWFLIEFLGSIDAALIPDMNEGITECKWVSIDQIKETLDCSYVRIQYLLDFFINMPFYIKYKKNF
tara:strand:- start:196 stop:642 length:447 start_codon:yes stop_codon:yes gene_type:complete